MRVEEILKVLKRRGIERLNPVQEKALNAGLLDLKNMLVVSPTASGKTLIAEIGMINALEKIGGKCVYVTPLRALASEKYRLFKDFWGNLGFKVAITSGDYDAEDEWLENYEIIVTTYEKFDSLWRHSPRWLRKVNYVVLDEIHFIGDIERGSKVEAVATKAKLSDIKVLALSATIPNSEEIASWLNAEHVKVDWRPVPLREGVLTKVNSRAVVLYSNGEKKELGRGDPIALAVKDVLEKRGQVLIFRNSRRNSESEAVRLSGLVSNYAGNLDDVINQVMKVEEGTKKEKELLSGLLIKGISYHHAGLSRAHREIIERSFLERKLKVIVATPTLAAGVNLPARLVIVEDIFRYSRDEEMRKMISVMEYKQMSGRAGRPGFDEVGEALIFTRREDMLEEVFNKYIKNPEIEHLESRLIVESNMENFILEFITSRKYCTMKELKNGISSTFAYHQYGGIDDKRIERMVNKLLDAGFVNEENGKFVITKLGKRVSELYISPETARLMVKVLMEFDDLCKYNYLQLLGLTENSPILSTSGENYLRYDENCKEVFEENEFLYDSSNKLASIILDWIEEVDEDDICDKYSIGSGDLRNYIETLEWLAYSASEISKVLGLKKHEEELRKLTFRISKGVKEELLNLILIPGVGRRRARALYNAGIKTVEELLDNKEKVIRLFGERIGVAIINEAENLRTEHLHS